ncbi:hypothetical protein P7C70_g6224, partial [Phenoliferia sp. Uapishka_3]
MVEASLPGPSTTALSLRPEGMVLKRSKSTLTLPTFLRRSSSKRQPGTDSPFADPASRQADNNAMRDALKDVVVSQLSRIRMGGRSTILEEAQPRANERLLPCHISRHSLPQSIRPVENSIRPVERSTTMDSLDAYGGDDIISSYADRSPSGSPVKERSSSGLGDQQRSPSKTNDELSSSSNRRKENSSKTSRKPAPDVLDVIDRLDISGLYGGGALMRHDGPFAAATASRNKGPRAPMAAFDPSALAPPTSSSSRPPRSSSNNLSARAQAALNAMENENGGSFAEGSHSTGDGERPNLGRRASESSITMGFPSGGRGKGNSQQLIEIYGVRENEAWQDFGTGRYTPGQENYASSRESVLPPGVSKEDRMGRAQSIWDIEVRYILCLFCPWDETKHLSLSCQATLRAGKPVGQAPPPLPVLPSQYNNGSSSDKPKRSKSLAARFRAGRRNPNNPMDEGEGQEGGEQSYQHRSPPLDETREEKSQFDGDEPVGVAYRDENQPGSGNVRFESTPLTSPTRKESVSAGPPSSMNRFAGSSTLTNTRSLGQEGQHESPQLGRRPSVMQRLFNKRGATKAVKPVSSTGSTAPATAFTVILQRVPFVLSHDQVTTDSPNFFTAAFLSDFKEASTRTLYTDRSPILFQFILDHLSGYAILPLPHIPTMTPSTALHNLLHDAQYFGLSQLEAELIKALNPSKLEAQAKADALRSLGYSRRITLEDLATGEARLERDPSVWSTGPMGVMGEDKRLVPLVGDSLPPLITIKDVDLKITFNQLYDDPEGTLEISVPKLSPTVTAPPSPQKGSADDTRLRLFQSIWTGIASDPTHRPLEADPLILLDGHSSDLSSLRLIIRDWWLICHPEDSAPPSP